MKPSEPIVGIHELLTRARAGDRRAEERLFSELHARIFALAKRRVWDAEAAADLAQETIRTAYEKYRDAALPRGLLPWVLAILRNKIGNYLKRRRTEQAHLERSPDLTDRPGGGPAPDGALGAIELTAALRKALPAMSAECRRIFRLLLGGADRGEIAAAFAGTPLGTVDSRISRCRQRLLARLAQGPANGGRHG